MTSSGFAARNQRGLRGLWSWTFGAAMWRAVIYGLLSLPAGVACLLMGLVGAHNRAARLQVGLAEGWLHLPLGPSPGGGYRWGRVITQALLTSVIGLLCWLLVALAGPNTVRNLLYGVFDGDSYAGSWGGPTLAGAWAVHAALALVILPLELWMIRGLTVLQGRLTARLLGPDRSWWVLPAAILVAAFGLLILRGFINQA
jgi:hypothetical protein